MNLNLILINLKFSTVLLFLLKQVYWKNIEILNKPPAPV